MSDREVSIAFLYEGWADLKQLECDNLRAYLLEVLTALGQQQHHRDVPGAMTMPVEVRAGLIRRGWELL